MRPSIIPILIRIPATLAATVEILSQTYTGRCDDAQSYTNVDGASTILTTSLIPFIPSANPSDRSNRCTVIYNLALSEPNHHILINQNGGEVRGWVQIDGNSTVLIKATYQFPGDFTQGSSEWIVRGPQLGKFGNLRDNADDTGVRSPCNPAQLQINYQTRTTRTDSQPITQIPVDPAPGEGEWIFSTDLLVYPCFNSRQRRKEN
ncbi:hypothetical protein CC78DRAFT_614977 [Lojkania enalia]|uniref:Secreted protein n=1 Tax=Lojkania enalia TaxID=147567 RepID=A0A9P4KC02_9PLEO|nr:hypothetical protein CC78DRAFT_614977 [Didymosphaeria enalia]